MQGHLVIRNKGQTKPNSASNIFQTRLPTGDGQANGSNLK